MSMMKKLFYIVVFIFLGLFFTWLFKAKAAEESVISEEGLTTEMNSEAGEMGGNETSEIEPEKPVEEVISAAPSEITPDGEEVVTPTEEELAPDQSVEEGQPEEMMPIPSEEPAVMEGEEEMSSMEEEMPEE